MKVLHGLIGFALSLAILALGGILVATVIGVQNNYLLIIKNVLVAHNVWQFALGISCITLTVLYWLSGLPLGRTEQFLSFPGDGGAISISVLAINTFLVKLQSEFAGIVKLRADVSASRSGAIEVRLDMTVKTGTHIQQLSQAVQQRVRESMRESLGIEDVAEVKVNVTDIVTVDEDPDVRRPPRAEWQENP
jgi:uncharacterized alkaline shock family protein YloU